jgi:hypothetical protein
MLKHDAMFFVAALFFIFLIWVATGGPTRPISWAGPFLNAPTPLGSGGAYFLPGAGFKIGSSFLPSANFAIGGGETSLGGSSAPLDPLIYGPTSQYHGQVYFTGNSSDEEQTLADVEYITLQTSTGADTNIPITGWKFISMQTGNSATIGTAAVVPVSGAVNTTGAIILHPGNTAYFTSGRSPTGISFRENICAGYLDQYQQLTPIIALQCPSPTAEYVDTYGDRPNDDPNCLNFVNSLAQCENVTRLPITSDGNPLSSRCYSFATQHLSYNSCVANHSKDIGFPGTVWHFFFGRSTELWAQPHDTIKLVDSSGKTVDVFSY